MNRSSALFYLAVIGPVIFLLAACLIVNEGNFIYTLDDPYIHLTLADQIAKGHYGLMAGEFASPASSILWPFLLAPFSILPYSYLAPLIINLLAYMLTAKLMYVALWRAYPRHAVWVLLFLLFATNTLGLLFSGMEHSLQVLASVAIVTALLEVTEGRPLPRWAALAIVIGPLIRYELLALSFSAILLLAWHRQFRYLPLGLAIIGLIGGFSFFLWSHSGSMLPASVMAKLDSPLVFPNFLILVFLLAAVLYFMRVITDTSVRAFFLFLFAVGVAHLLCGKFGWFARYEAYIITVSGFALAYYTPRVNQVINKPHNLTALFMVPVFFACAIYGVTTLSVPVASHGIYAQQVQMRRLLDRMQFPSVAVNDIGYISSRYPSHVVDLFGLGSLDIQEIRRKAEAGWMGKVTSGKGVKIAMFYQNWFAENAMPRHWQLLGWLELTNPMPGMLLSVGSTKVAFYSTGPDQAARILRDIEAWKKELPPSASWVAAESPENIDAAAK